MASNFVIDPVKKKILTELVNSGKNTLLTGGTGCGKTTLAIEIAKELGLKPVVINCGSTQDARSSLLGYFTLKDGDTVFQEADFLKAIQEENTLIILDELSRASDDAYNIIFPLLDFRKEVHVEETGETIKVADGVRFISTANVGLEYSSARSIDRALQDRFMIFNIPYMTGKELKGYIKTVHGKEIASSMANLCSVYDYSHQQYEKSRISAKMSPRMILNCCSLVGKFTDAEVMNNVLLSMFEQDSSSITSDANIMREYADSLGMFN